MMCFGESAKRSTRVCEGLSLVLRQTTTLFLTHSLSVTHRFGETKRDIILQRFLKFN